LEKQRNSIRYTSLCNVESGKKVTMREFEGVIRKSL